MLNVEESERGARYLGGREMKEGGREWAKKFAGGLKFMCVLVFAYSNELVPRVKSTLWVSISLKNLALTSNMRSINLEPVLEIFDSLSE